MVHITEVSKNALAQAAIETIGAVCGQALEQGALYKHHRAELPNCLAIRLEMTGDVVGHVLIRFTEENAKKIASSMMMGMPIEELDDMSISALSELGNMIMGGASIHLEENGLHTDITTPKVLIGNIDVHNTISIPLTNADLRVVLDISLDTKKS